MAEETFLDVHLGGKVKGPLGQLHVTSSGFAWKSSSGKRVNVLRSELKSARWVNIGATGRLILLLKTGSVVTFDGLKNFDVLAKYFSEQFDMPLEKEELSFKGWNWGKVAVEDKTLSFLTNGKPTFEIPLGDIAQATADPKKSEVTVQFPQDEGADTSQSLVEMRFYVPPSTTEGENSEGVTIKSAEEFQRMLLRHAEIMQPTGQGIATLSQVQLLVPRGRYDFELFPTFMKVRGKNKEYRVLYSSVTRLTHLEIPNGREHQIIISLDPPIRQGLTPYPHLVLKIANEQKFSVKFDMTEEELAEKYENLELEMEGEYEVLLKVLKAVTGKKITKKGNFQSYRSANAVACSLRANEGWLFPLERSFFFTFKPPLFISFDNISKVEFARVSPNATGGQNRTFDLIVVEKGQTEQTYAFTSIAREEYHNIYQFLQGKKLKITGTLPEEEQVREKQRQRNQEMEMLDDEDEEEDEDFVAGSDDDDDEFDENEDDDEDGDADVGGGDDDDDEEEEDEEEEEEEEAAKPPKKRSRPSEKDAGPPKKRSKKKQSSDEEDDDE